LLDSLLVGCPFEDKEHQKAGEKGDNNHPYPGTHAAEGIEEGIEYFAEDRIEDPHGLRDITKPFQLFLDFFF
jgi:hypothetical protein